MGKVVTIGEPMAMFVAKTPGELKDVASFDRFIAGAEVNVSVGVSRLGHQIQYITQLGRDPFGEHIADFLKAEAIDTSLITFNPNYPTGFQLKNKDSKRDPEVVYFRKGSAAYHLNDEIITAIDFTDVDIFHVTGILMALNDTTFELVKKLVLKAKAQKTLITFDPNLRPTLWASEELMKQRIHEIASHSDYFLPGLAEANLLTGLTDVEEIADYYLALGNQGVIIKEGPEGAYAKWRTSNGLQSLQKAGFRLAEVVDTVGAGDGFAVGVVTGLLEQLSMEATLERANAIGAIQVSHISDNENLPTPEELIAFIKKYQREGEAYEITSGN